MREGGKEGEKEGGREGGREGERGRKGRMEVQSFTGSWSWRLIMFDVIYSCRRREIVV